MSTDTFEDTLRGMLRESADAEGSAYLELDPAVVVARGRRVVRRRRAVVGLGVAAASVAVGLVGFSALGSGSDRTSTPAGTTSPATTATGTVRADLTRGAMVGDTWGPPTGRPSVRVSVDLTRQLLSSSLLGADGRESDAASTTLLANPRAATWTTTDGSEGLATGILPAAATDVVFLWNSGPAEVTQDLEPLPGTPYQAFAQWRDRGTDDPVLTGLIWTDGAAVYDSVGAEVLNARSGPDLVFADRRQGLFGVFSDGSNATKRFSENRVGGVPALMTGRMEDGADVMETTVLLVLPAGATKAAVTASEGVTLRSSETFDGGTIGDTLVVARLTVPKDVGGTGVERVTWRNADGTSGSSTASG